MAETPSTNPQSTDARKQQGIPAKPLSDERVHLHELVHKVRRGLTTTKFSGSIGGNVPAFGQLSLMAERTPIYVVDHPALTKRIKTAATDGHLVLFNADFVEKLVRDSKKHGGQNIAPIMMHELMHQLLDHMKRRYGFVPEKIGNLTADEIQNIGEDLVINPMLMDAYEAEITFGNYWNKKALGVSDEGRDYWRKRAEVDVIREIVDHLNNQQQNQQQCQSGGGAGGAGSGGAGQGSGQPQNSGQSQQQDPDNELPGLKPCSDEEDPDQDPDICPDPENDTSLPEGQPSVIDKIDPQTLRDILEQAGMQYVADALDLPKNDEEAEAYQEKNDARVENDTAKMQRMQEKAEENGSSIPGKDITDAARQRIEASYAPRIAWKDALQQVATEEPGSGKLQPVEELQDENYQAVDWTALGFDGDIVMPAMVPMTTNKKALFVMDTSGSVSDELAKQFVSEIKNILQTEDVERDLVVLTADTAIAGDPQHFTEDDLDDLINGGMDIAGRGGTEIKGCIHEAMNMAREQQWDVDALVYLSDLCDYLPRADELPENAPPRILYVAPEGARTPERINQVSEYADIVEIAEGEVADLSPGDRPEPTRPSSAAPH